MAIKVGVVSDDLEAYRKGEVESNNKEKMAASAATTATTAAGWWGASHVGGVGLALLGTAIGISAHAVIIVGAAGGAVVGLAGYGAYRLFKKSSPGPEAGR